MGLGEVIYGAAKGLSDIVFLTVGTGIGGALFLNGRLYGGYRNRGTELGHLIIHGLNGNQCTCGASGCLEAHASVSALIALYRQLLEKNGREIPSRIDGKYIVERYKDSRERGRTRYGGSFPESVPRRSEPYQHFRSAKGDYRRRHFGIRRFLH